MQSFVSGRGLDDLQMDSYKVTDTVILYDNEKPTALNVSDCIDNKQLEEIAVGAEAVTASRAAEIDDKMTDLIFGDKTSFPLNLTCVLESVEAMGLAHIICWTKDEKKFVIHDVDAFLNDVLPKFFK